MGHLRVQEYDGLRAIAVSLVFLYHYDENLFFFGWVGVDLFFAISGFVITLQCHSLVENNSRKAAVTEFFVRRVTRILPLYYGVLLLLFCCTKLVTSFSLLPEFVESQPDLLLVDTLWKNALFLTNIYIFLDGYQSVAYGITWSLAVEEHFYLLFPFVFFYMRQDKRVLAFASLVIGFFVLRFVLSLVNEFPGRLYFLTFTRFDSLLVGCLFAQMYKDQIRIPLIRTLCCIGILVSFVMLSTLLYRDWLMITFGYLIIPATVALIMYYIAFSQPLWTRTVLANRFMVRVGSVSYGMYLLHIWIVDGFAGLGMPELFSEFLGDAFGYIVLLCLEFGLTISASVLSFRFLESPSRRILMGYFNRTKSSTIQTNRICA